MGSAGLSSSLGTSSGANSSSLGTWGVQDYHPHWELHLGLIHLHWGHVGAVGSDDDIRIKICDRAKCCTTKELSHTFSSEWKKNKLETWDGRKLGNCSDILFDDKLSSVEVSIVKELSKKDPLEVTSIALSAQVGSDKKIYNCSNVEVIHFVQLIHSNLIHV